MADVRNESFSVSLPSMWKVSPPCPRLALGLAAVLERTSALPSPRLAFSMAGKEEGDALAGSVPETSKWGLCSVRCLVLVEEVELNAGGSGLCAMNSAWPLKGQVGTRNTVAIGCQSMFERAPAYMYS